LALPELASVLTYHVLGTEVASSAVTNGAIVQPLSTLNTLKLTKTSNGDVFVNHAQVTTVDINADNGIVHVLDAVVLPIETVVDVAIDNGFSTLTAAVVKAELVPVLSDPFSEFTVFAPTNTAFNSLATALGTDLNGILALPNLADILTYHVVDGTVLSNQLVAGPVGTLNGNDVIVTITGGVKINDANVTTADVLADNGVVHVIDKVLLPSSVGVNENQENKISVFPNPTENFITLEVKNSTNYSLVDLNGRTLQNGVINNNDSIDLSSLNSGSYILRLSNENGSQNLPIIKK
jgi:transforming growth factor-beta-induced protein